MGLMVRRRREREKESKMILHQKPKNKTHRALVRVVERRLRVDHDHVVRTLRVEALTLVPRHAVPKRASVAAKDGHARILRLQLSAPHAAVHPSQVHPYRLSVAPVVVFGQVDVEGAVAAYVWGGAVFVCVCVFR